MGCLLLIQTEMLNLEVLNMQRVVLDTNIYGLIVVDEDRTKVRNKIEKEKIVVVYGLQLIRKELRDTPKNIKVEGANLRNYLLSIYDEITKNHTLKFTDEAENLAESYFNIYKELGGYASRVEIMKDFVIVGSASLNYLDIVVSNDNKTMLSDKSIKAYRIVNSLKNIRMPRFMSYEEFKKELK